MKRTTAIFFVIAGVSSLSALPCLAAEPSAIAEQIKLILEDDFTQFPNKPQSLADLGRGAVPDLLNRLDPNDIRSVDVIFALALLKDRRATEPLAQLLSLLVKGAPNDMGSGALADTTIYTLGEIRDPSVVPELLPLLDGRFRYATLIGLVAIADPSPVARRPLLAIVDDDTASIPDRVRAAHCLLRIESHRSKKHAAQFLLDKDRLLAPPRQIPIPGTEYMEPESGVEWDAWTSALAELGTEDARQLLAELGGRAFFSPDLGAVVHALSAIDPPNNTTLEGLWAMTTNSASVETARFEAMSALMDIAERKAFTPEAWLGANRFKQALATIRNESQWGPELLAQLDVLDQRAAGWASAEPPGR